MKISHSDEPIVQRSLAHQREYEKELLKLARILPDALPKVQRAVHESARWARETGNIFEAAHKLVGQVMRKGMLQPEEFAAIARIVPLDELVPILQRIAARKEA